MITFSKNAISSDCLLSDIYTGKETSLQNLT